MFFLLRSLPLTLDEMGSAWSLVGSDEALLAKSDMCDDETWTNTILNGSSCSVQDRVNLQDWDVLPFESLGLVRRKCTGKRLKFASHHTVCTFEKEDVESMDYGDLDYDDDDEASREYEDDVSHEYEDEVSREFDDDGSHDDDSNVDDDHDGNEETHRFRVSQDSKIRIQKLFSKY